MARTASSFGSRPSVAPLQSSAAPRPSAPGPASTGGGTETKRSVPPGPLNGVDGVPVALWAQLLDRLATVDEASFVATWIESTVGARARPEPPLVVRLLRAYREMAAFDKARELAAALPSAPTSWNPLDVARLFYGTGAPRPRRRPVRPR